MNLCRVELKYYFNYIKRNNNKIDLSLLMYNETKHLNLRTDTCKTSGLIFTKRSLQCAFLSYTVENIQ